MNGFYFGEAEPMELVNEAQEQQEAHAFALNMARQRLERERAEVTRRYHAAENEARDHVLNLRLVYTNPDCSYFARLTAFRHASAVAHMWLEAANLRAYLFELFEDAELPDNGNHGQAENMCRNVANSFPVMLATLESAFNAQNAGAFEAVLAAQEALLCGMTNYRQAAQAQDEDEGW